MPGLRRVALLALPLLLAACGGSKEEDDERSASGEVLEGTISDAMLPVDTVSSQPPLAEPERARGGGAGPSDAATGAVEDGDEAAGDAAEAPAPAAAE